LQDSFFGQLSTYKQKMHDFMLSSAPEPSVTALPLVAVSGFGGWRLFLRRLKARN
jgi:hypothetical protein